MRGGQDDSRIDVGSTLSATPGSPGTVVEIDFCEPAAAERLAERAKAFYDGGLLVKQVAAELKVSRNLVAAALRHWFVSRGLPVPDGRSRRTAGEGSRPSFSLTLRDRSW